MSGGDQARPPGGVEAGAEGRAAGPRAPGEGARRPAPRSDESAADLRLAATIARHQARRERAAREPRSSLWRHVARVGTLGWMIALPMAAGAVIGRLIDRRLESGVTWTLALILIGAAAGGYSLWKMLASEVEP